MTITESKIYDAGAFLQAYAQLNESQEEINEENLTEAIEAVEYWNDFNENCYKGENVDVYEVVRETEKAYLVQGVILVWNSRSRNRKGKGFQGKFWIPKSVIAHKSPSYGSMSTWFIQPWFARKIVNEKVS